MAESNYKAFSVTEWLVLAVVLFATISFQPEQDDLDEIEYRSTTITGVVELSTRSAMDALGLDDFKIGPLATVDLVSNPVVSKDCLDCQFPVSGINIQGSVVITELIDQDDRRGRVEAELNLTYLREINSQDLVFREWLIFDWDAGELSTHLEIHIIHDPPRWSPDTENHAAYIDLENGLKTRSGPEILIQTLSENKSSISGCLPDSFLCRASNPDVNMMSTSSNIEQQISINQPQTWNKFNISQTGETPNETLSIRDLFQLENEITQTESWCPSTDQPIVNSKSWEVSYSKTTISPLSSWLYALSIPTNSFTPSGEIWTEIEFDNFSCATLTDTNGNLNIGILFS